MTVTGGSCVSLVTTLMSSLEEDNARGPAPEPSTSARRFENQDREQTPEPDVDLDISRGRHQVWLVKVPQFLINGWNQINQDDVQLGTVRVYE